MIASLKKVTFESLQVHCVKVAQNVANNDTGTVAETSSISSGQNVDTICSGGFQWNSSDYGSICRLYQLLLRQITTEQT